MGYPHELKRFAKLSNKRTPRSRTWRCDTTWINDEWSQPNNKHTQPSDAKYAQSCDECAFTRDEHV